ncbi:MAG: NTP transferase domain-containing protein [Armatimonadetes bacterium]|nr:NTP transferase domain-containing protein [Armatimonadota bacterium]
MDAIVLAGGRLKGRFARATGRKIKALVEINGRTLLERTLHALASSQSVDRIVTVGPPEVREIAEGVGGGLYASEAKTAIDNLMVGVRALQAEGRILVSTSDLAVMRPEDVDDFVQRVPEGAGVSYAVFSKSEYHAAFPNDLHERFVPLKDGRFTGGCVFIADALTLQRIEAALQVFFRARKLALAMAWRVGGGAFVRFILSLLVGRWLAPTTDDLRRKAEQMLDCQASIVRGASARLALDVDTRRDLRFVKDYVAEQERGANTEGLLASACRHLR